MTRRYSPSEVARMGGLVGGRATTLRKARAARANGCRGGRPRRAVVEAVLAAERRRVGLFGHPSPPEAARSDYCGVQGDGHRVAPAPRLDDLDEVGTVVAPSLWPPEGEEG